MPDPQALVDAAQDSTILEVLALVCIAMLVVGGGVTVAAIRVIGLLTKVHSALTNHLTHAIGELAEETRGLRRGQEEQTLVLRAMGRELLELRLALRPETAEQERERRYC